MVSHVRINGTIWEINLEEKKALLRSEAGMNPEALLATYEVPVLDIESYIQKFLEFPHIKQVRPTKFIYSKYPICNFVDHHPRSDNPDATFICQAIATVQPTDKGWRCSEHRNS